MASSKRRSRSAQPPIFPFASIVFSSSTDASTKSHRLGMAFAGLRRLSRLKRGGAGMKMHHHNGKSHHNGKADTKHGLQAHRPTGHHRHDGNADQHDGKPRKKHAAEKTTAASYERFKEFEGQRYTGMKIGRSHKWYYD